MALLLRPGRRSFFLRALAGIFAGVWACLVDLAMVAGLCGCHVFRPFIMCSNLGLLALEFVIREKLRGAHSYIQMSTTKILGTYW